MSGPERDQRGSLLELSWGGTEPLALADGSTRTFLEDGDVVTLTASAPGPGGSADLLRRGHRDRPQRGERFTPTLISSSGTSCPSVHRTSTATAAPQPTCRSRSGPPGSSAR